jgi:hypothetical protein
MEMKRPGPKNDADRQAAGKSKIEATISAQLAGHLPLIKQIVRMTSVRV